MARKQTTSLGYEVCFQAGDLGLQFARIETIFYRIFGAIGSYFPHFPYPPSLSALPPSPPPHTWSRRKLIQTASLAALGAGTAIGINKFLRPDPPTPVVSPEPANRPIPVATPSPEPLHSSAVPSGELALQSFDFETVTVNHRGAIIDRRPGQAKFFAEELGNGVMLEMVEIPGGKFFMGSPLDEAGREENESPQHEVTVPAFFMGQFEVTQAQYEAIVGNNPARFKGKKRPVDNVAWDDAIEFCRRLSQKTGRQYRLPSEAEWEYACRAGTTTPFYLGATITTDLANYNGRYAYGRAAKGQDRQQTTEVGRFPPNAFGLYDMHGNVYEWCEDIWHSNYDNAPTNGSAWVTDGNPNYRMLRGGSWDISPVYCRSAYRSYDSPDHRDFIYYIGFRVVCSVL